MECLRGQPAGDPVWPGLGAAIPLLRALCAFLKEVDSRFERASGSFAVLNVMTGRVFEGEIGAEMVSGAAKTP